MNSCASCLISGLWARISAALAASIALWWCGTPASARARPLGQVDLEDSARRRRAGTAAERGAGRARVDRRGQGDRTGHRRGHRERGNPARRTDDGLDGAVRGWLRPGGRRVDRAGPEAAGGGPGQPGADPAPLPLVGPVLVVEDPAPLLFPAAAAVAVRPRADEEVALDLDDPEVLAAGAHLDRRDPLARRRLAAGRVAGRAGAAGAVGVA